MLICGMLVPHTPRFLDPNGPAPVSQRAMRSCRVLGAEVARLRPDAIIVASAHSVTTSSHYVGGAPRLAGVLTSAETPELARDVAWDEARHHLVLMLPVGDAPTGRPG